MIEAELGVMHPQVSAKDCWQPLEAKRQYDPANGFEVLVFNYVK